MEMEKNLIKAGLNDLQLELWLRQRENGSIVWQTKNGHTIPIDKMSDEHLINAINHMTEYNEKQFILQDLEGSLDWLNG